MFSAVCRSTLIAKGYSILPGTNLFDTKPGKQKKKNY